MQGESHTSTLCRKSSLGLNSCKMGQKTVEMCSPDRQVQVLGCFLEKQTLGSLCQRKKRTPRPLSVISEKNSVCDGKRVHLCLRHESLAYVWRYYPQRGVYRDFKDTVCCHQGNIFFLEKLVDNETMPGLILCATKVWLRRQRVLVFDWSDLQAGHFIVEKYMTHHKEENQTTPNIPLANLQQLVSSVPNQLQSVMKRKGDETQGKHASIPTSIPTFKCVAVIKV